MNFKKRITVLLILGSVISTSYSQVLFQAYLIEGKDSFTMWRTFITGYSQEVKITSKETEMSVASCFFGSYMPIWRIENDSIFLIKLIDNRNRDSSFVLDLQETFKGRCVNGRVFGKEISFQIDAQRYIENSIPSQDTQFCFTIRDGKIIDRGKFENKTEYINDNDYVSEEAIFKNTDWKHLPDIAVDRQVTIKITTDNGGKIINAVPVKNSNIGDIIKVEGEEVWRQEALRQVKLIPQWHIRYKCGQVVDKEQEIVFLFQSHTK